MPLAASYLRTWGETGVPGWREMSVARIHGGRTLQTIAYLDDHWASFERALD